MTAWVGYRHARQCLRLERVVRVDQELELPVLIVREAIAVAMEVALPTGQMASDRFRSGWPRRGWPQSRLALRKLALVARNGRENSFELVHAGYDG